MEAAQRPVFFLYDFLTGARYRVCRHVLLVLAMLIIALNQTYMVYGEALSKSNKGVFLSTIAVAAFYLGAIYYNLYVLVPRFLFMKRYLKFVGGSVLSAVFLVGMIDLTEYVTHLVMRLPVGENSILNPQYSLVAELVFTFPLLAVCIVGGSATSLLREWGVENKNILLLKKSCLHAELEQLKERISPGFLFKILNKAGKLSVTDPEHSSSMLVGLSRVLRYQLYDCSRNEVLFDSEVTFIRNYLALYCLYNRSFTYNVVVSGDSDRVFIPPLLFVPLIQLIINKSAEEASLQIDFILSGRGIGFMCTVTTEEFEQIEDTDVSNVHRRLKFLYGDSWQLVRYGNRIALQLNGAAQ